MKNVIVVGLLMALATPLLASEPVVADGDSEAQAEAVEEGEAQEGEESASGFSVFLSMFNPFSRTGIWMFLILLVSIVTVVVIAERVFVLWYRYKIDARTMLERIFSFVDNRNYSRALSLCNNPHPVCSVLKSVLLKANRADREMQRTMERSSVGAQAQITKRVSHLSMLANASTLLGLLGTIFGLILAFEGVTQANVADKHKILAMGISVAMSTTAFGLIVAIPATVAHSLLTSRQNVLLDILEDSSMALFHHLSEINRTSQTQPVKDRKLNRRLSEEATAT